MRYTHSNSVAASGDTFTGPVKFADGSAAAPSITFTNDSDTGFFKSSGGVLDISINANARHAISSDFLRSADTLGYQINRAAGTAAAPTYTFRDDSDTGMYRAASDDMRVATGGNDQFKFGNGTQIISSNSNLAWGSSGVSSPDLKFFRDAANTLAQRNGTNAQTTNIYNTFTDASNFERAKLGWSANRFEIETSAQGTGTSRSLRLITTTAQPIEFATTNTVRMTVDSGGNVGIGEASPQGPLHVFNATNPSIRMGTTAASSGSNSLIFGLATTANAFITGSANGDTAFAAKSGGDLIIGTSASGAQLERIRIDSAGDVGIGSASTGAKLFLDQNSDASAIEIDSESTTVDVISVVTPQTTTGAVFSTGASALTTGKIANFYSNSASTSTRSLQRIWNDNTLATGATLLELRQDAAQRALFIDQNADADALVIDTEAATSHGINLDSALTTTGNVFRATGIDSLTTGKIIHIQSNSSDTGTRTLQQITNDNTLATGATCLSIQQDAAQRALFIDQNGDSQSLVIDSESTTVSTIFVDSPQTTSGNVFNVNNANSLTTGKILRLYSNSSSAATRSLVEIVNDNTLATGATPLVIQQDAAQRALFIDQNADDFSIEIDSEATTNSVIQIVDPQATTASILNINLADALTTGRIANFASNSADTSARFLVNIVNDNVAATGAVPLALQQDAANSAMDIFMGTVDAGFCNYRATADADTTSAISTLTTSGATTHHIQVEINGTKAWIAASTNAPS